MASLIRYHNATMTCVFQQHGVNNLQQYRVQCKTQCFIRTLYFWDILCLRTNWVKTNNTFSRRNLQCPHWDPADPRQTGTGPSGSESGSQRSPVKKSLFFA